MGAVIVAAAPDAASPSAAFDAMFADSWPMLLDLVKSTAPWIVGAALTLLAIRWVVGAVSKGKAPSLDVFAGSVDTYEAQDRGRAALKEWSDKAKAEGTWTRGNYDREAARLKAQRKAAGF